MSVGIDVWVALAQDLLENDRPAFNRLAAYFRQALAEENARLAYAHAQASTPCCRRAEDWPDLDDFAITVDDYALCLPILRHLQGIPSEQDVETQGHQLWTAFLYAHRSVEPA